MWCWINVDLHILISFYVWYLCLVLLIRTLHLDFQWSKKVPPVLNIVYGSDYTRYRPKKQIAPSLNSGGINSWIREIFFYLSYNHKNSFESTLNKIIYMQKLEGKWKYTLIQSAGWGLWWSTTPLHFHHHPNIWNNKQTNKPLFIFFICPMGTSHNPQKAFLPQERKVVDTKI